MTLETVKSEDGKLERVILVDKKDCKKAFLQLPIFETASDIVKSRSVVDDIVTYMSEWLEKKGNNQSCGKDVDNGIYGCSIVPCHRMQPEKEKNGSWVTHAGPSYVLQIYGIEQDEAFKLGRDMKEKIQLSITVMYCGSEPERSLITG